MLPRTKLWQVAIFKLFEISSMMVLTLTELAKLDRVKRFLWKFINDRTLFSTSPPANLFTINLQSDASEPASCIA